MAVNIQEMNLDCMFYDDLEIFAEEILDESTIDKPSRVLLSQYAAHKARAMRHRLRGYIALAIKEERLCDLVYSKLPDDLKW